MASSFVFYKFKSQREPSRIAFDGTSITVFDLKKEIIAENKMGKGADFDFAIYHADTEEGRLNPLLSAAPAALPRRVCSSPAAPGLARPPRIPLCLVQYQSNAFHYLSSTRHACTAARRAALTRPHRVPLSGDIAREQALTLPFLSADSRRAEYTKDHELIPRSTSVIARRLPPARPGRGNATKYMAGAEESGQGIQAGRGAAPEPRGGVGSSFNKDMYTKRFDGREGPSPSGSNQVRPHCKTGLNSSPGSPRWFDSSGPSLQNSVQIPSAAPNDEASAMAAMFAATNTQWQQTQEQMAKCVGPPVCVHLKRTLTRRVALRRSTAMRTLRIELRRETALGNRTDLLSVTPEWPTSRPRLDISATAAVKRVSLFERAHDFSELA